MALCIAIINPCMPEMAFDRLAGNRKKYRFSDVDTSLMARFREEGYTYRQIGEYYGVNQWAIFRHMKAQGLIPGQEDAKG